jgi:hypothetical protein
LQLFTARVQAQFATQIFSGNPDAKRSELSQVVAFITSGSAHVSAKERFEVRAVLECACAWSGVLYEISVMSPDVFFDNFSQLHGNWSLPEKERCVLLTLFSSSLIPRSLPATFEKLTEDVFAILRDASPGSDLFTIAADSLENLIARAFTTHGSGTADLGIARAAAAFFGGLQATDPHSYRFLAWDDRLRPVCAVRTPSAR